MEIKIIATICAFSKQYVIFSNDLRLNRIFNLKTERPFEVYLILLILASSLTRSSQKSQVH